MRKGNYKIPGLLILIMMAILPSVCHKSQANVKVDGLIKTNYVCPDCGEWGCIYEDIDTYYDGNNVDIDEAIQEVCNDRGITDTETIDLLKANYEQ